MNYKDFINYNFNQAQFEEFKFVRRHEYEELRNKIEFVGYDIINLHGGIGSGKTTIVQKLKKDLEWRYRIKIFNAEYGLNEYYFEGEDILVLDNLDHYDTEEIQNFVKRHKVNIRKIILVTRDIVYLQNELVDPIRVDYFGDKAYRNIFEYYLKEHDEELTTQLNEVFDELEASEEFQSLDDETEIIEKVQKTFVETIQNYVKLKGPEAKINFTKIFPILLALTLYFLQTKNLSTAKDEIINFCSTDKVEIQLVIDNTEHNYESHYVTTTSINLRSSAREEDNVLWVVNEGELVEVIEKREDWWYVNYDCKNCDGPIKGFLHSDYLRPIAK